MSKYKKIRVSANQTVDEHRLVWEYYFGSIPDGYVIHHKDNNKSNNSIENLECMSREDHARLHVLDNPISMPYEQRLEINRKSREKLRKSEVGSACAWCNSCKQYLPKEDFGTNNSRYNGLSNQCKCCRSRNRRASK